MQGDVQAKQGDLIALVIQSVSSVRQVENEAGEIETETAIDKESLWYKTLDVSSNTFSRFALELEELARYAKSAYSSMPYERASQLENEINQIIRSYKLSIDAKGSESILDKHNRKATLIDKIVRNRNEQIVRIDGEGKSKSSLMDAVLGKKKEDVVDNT